MPGPSGRKGDDDDDETWVPPKSQKPPPKNNALLQARAKKWAKKGNVAKSVLRCKLCDVTCYDRQQLKDHEKSHGS